MNPLFGMLNGNAENAHARPQNDAGRAPDNAMGNCAPANLEAAMGQLRANPAEMLKQAGYSLPGNMGNDPQKMVMHLVRSGQIGGPMMRMISPMLARLGVK